MKNNNKTNNKNKVLKILTFFLFTILDSNHLFSMNNKRTKYMNNLHFFSKDDSDIKFIKNGSLFSKEKLIKDRRVELTNALETLSKNLNREELEKKTFNFPEGLFVYMQKLEDLQDYPIIGGKDIYNIINEIFNETTIILKNEKKNNQDTFNVISQVPSQTDTFATGDSIDQQLDSSEGSHLLKEIKNLLPNNHNDRKENRTQNSLIITQYLKSANKIIIDYLTAKYKKETVDIKRFKNSISNLQKIDKKQNVKNNCCIFSRKTSVSSNLYDDLNDTLTSKEKILKSSLRLLKLVEVHNK